MAQPVKVKDMAFGWCKECDTQIGDWPVCGPWPVSKSIWMHVNGTGHTVRRISNDAAWAAVKGAHDVARSNNTGEINT